MLSKKEKKGLQTNFLGDLKKKVFTKIFQAISTKKRFQKNFSSAPQNFNNLKNNAVLDNFRGLEASRPRPRTSKSVLEDVLEAKDVLEDSTSERKPFPHACFK